MRHWRQILCILAIAGDWNGVRARKEIQFREHGRHLNLLILDVHGLQGVLNGYPASPSDDTPQSGDPSVDLHQVENVDATNIHSPETGVWEPREVLRESPDGTFISTHVTFAQLGSEQGLVTIPDQETESGECDDRAPEGATCSELVGFNGCTMAVIFSNGICRKSCGECDPPPPPSQPPAVELNGGETSGEVPISPEASDSEGDNVGLDSTKTEASDESIKPETPGKSVENGGGGKKSAPAGALAESSHEDRATQLDSSKGAQDSKVNGVGGNPKEIEDPPVDENPSPAKTKPSKTDGKGKPPKDFPSKGKKENESPASDSSGDTAGDKFEKNDGVQVNEPAPVSESSSGGESGLPKKSDPSGQCNSVTQVLDGRGNLSFMSELFKAAQNPLLKTVGDRSFIGTLFAPTNDAFDKALGELGTTREAFLSENPGLAEVVLDAHVVPGLPRTKFSDGQEFPTVTARFDIFVKSDDNGDVEIISQGDRAAKISEANIKACESVVHVVDNVLFPQTEENLKQMFLAKSNRPAAG